MKKIIFLTIFIIAIISTGCSFNHDNKISNLNDAYIYLSESSANKNNIESKNLKNLFNKFDLKANESEEIPLFNVNDLKRITSYDIKKQNSYINLILNETDNRVISVSLNNNDNNTKIEYSGYDELISIEEDVPDYNTLNLSSKIKNINDFNRISKKLDKNLNSNIFTLFDKLILNFSNKKTLKIEDIENIIKFKYNDKKSDKKSNNITYIFSDGTFSINVEYSKNHTINSIYLINDFSKQKDPKVSIEISYNQSDDGIQFALASKQSADDLLNLNNFLVDTFFNKNR